MTLPVSDLKAPTGTSPAARKVFGVIAGALAERGDLHPEYAFTIAAYAECVAEASACLRAGRTKRVTAGSMGQDRANPLFGEARAWMETARSYAVELGLSPAALAKMGKKRGGGRPKGSASAADRTRPPEFQLRMVNGGASS